jgi:AcrR family transcriptional regulator
MLIKEIPTEKHEDPRITRTRKLLVDALNELMREKSFEAITVSEIADRATLNRVTFYAHFQDKYALLEYSMRSLVRSQVHARLDASGPLTEAILQKLLALVCDLLMEITGHCPPPRNQMEALMEKQIKDELYTLLLGYLQAARPQRRSAASAEQAAMVAAWAIYGAAYQWSQDSERAAVDTFVRQVLPLVRGNLAPYLEASPQSQGGRRAAAGRAPSALLAYCLAY